MKIAQDDTVLHIVESTRLVALLAFAGGVFLAGWAVRDVLHHPSSYAEVWGKLAGAALFALGGAVFYRRGDFLFDKNSRKLLWRCQRLLGSRAGEIPFAEIAAVTVEQCGDKNSPGYRLVLRTPTGILPIQEGYSPGIKASCEAIAARIRDVLHNPKA